MANDTWLRPLRAVSGATWLFPFKGLFYFLAHPFLYPLLRARLLPVFFLSIFVYVILFFFTYLPQVGFLAIWHGWGAWLNATFLVLGEGAAIVGLLFEAFLCDETQVDIFDAVGLAALHAQSLRVLTHFQGPGRQRLRRPSLNLQTR